MVTRAQAKAYKVGLFPSCPEICRPCHRTSPRSSGSLPCQDLNSCRAKEVKFSTAAKFCDLNLSVRTAIVGASRPHLSSVTDPMGPHHVHQMCSPEFQVRMPSLQPVTYWEG